MHGIVRHDGMTVPLFNHLNHFRRNTSNDGIGGHIFGDDRSCGNDGIVTDGDALQDGYIRSEPPIIGSSVAIRSRNCSMVMVVANYFAISSKCSSAQPIRAETWGMRD